MFYKHARTLLIFGVFLLNTNVRESIINIAKETAVVSVSLVKVRCLLHTFLGHALFSSRSWTGGSQGHRLLTCT